MSLRDRILYAISERPCSRCMSRQDYHPEDCKKHDCWQMYEQEADAILEALKEWELPARIYAYANLVRNARLAQQASLEDPMDMERKANALDWEKRLDEATAKMLEYVEC